MNHLPQAAISWKSRILVATKGRSRSTVAGAHGVQNIPEWLTVVLKESPTLGTCLIIFFAAFWYITREHKSHIESKDSEIDRLVKEKNELQQLFLTERLSTKNALPPPKKGNK